MVLEMTSRIPSFTKPIVLAVHYYYVILLQQTNTKFSLYWLFVLENKKIKTKALVGSRITASIVCVPLLEMLLNSVSQITIVFCISCLACRQQT